MLLDWYGHYLPTETSGYADALSAEILPTALIQAQRDRFGDHGFRRTDRPGTHHGPWSDANDYTGK